MPLFKPRYWTITQIANHLGTSRYKAETIANKVVTFPEPIGQIRLGNKLYGRPQRVWRARDVKRWTRRYQPAKKLGLSRMERLGL